MTLRQKRVLAILALLDVTIIVSLIFVIANYAREYTGYRTPTVPYQPCQWWATQRLAQAGLAGSVTLVPDGPLRFEIIYPLDLTGLEAKPGPSAQSVWTAFDIALALRQSQTTPDELQVSAECPAFTRVEVTILATDTHIHASVRTPDLVAFGAGALSENEFIERVTYETMRNP